MYLKKYLLLLLLVSPGMHAIMDFNRSEGYFFSDPPHGIDKYEYILLVEIWWEMTRREIYKLKRLLTSQEKIILKAHYMQFLKKEKTVTADRLREDIDSGGLYVEGLEHSLDYRAADFLGIDL